MPLLSSSTYAAPVLFANPHVQTVFPQRFRHVTGLDYERERMETDDGDFMDLDWVRGGSDRLVVLLHGLEGNSRRPYMRGMARAFRRRGWDAVAANFRGCSGVPNRLLRSYHHGVSDDLHRIVSHALTDGRYGVVALVGFSLGANVVLKYLGEGVFPVPPHIKAAAAISAPCDLEACALKLEAKRYAFYMKHFLRMLRKKHRAKMAMFPGALDLEGYASIRTFREHDDRYTAVLHGFDSAEDYWRTCACGRFLERIKVPSLVLNAADDPFLAESCYPTDVAGRSSVVYLEVPARGGHVGFVTFRNRGEYWHEARVAVFVEQMVSS